jgi:hypothetical protein
MIICRELGTSGDVTVHIQNNILIFFSAIAGKHYKKPQITTAEPKQRLKFGISRMQAKYVH